MMYGEFHDIQISKHVEKVSLEKQQLSTDISNFNVTYKILQQETDTHW